MVCSRRNVARQSLIKECVLPIKEQKVSRALFGKQVSRGLTLNWPLRTVSTLIRARRASKERNPLRAVILRGFTHKQLVKRNPLEF